MDKLCGTRNITSMKSRIAGFDLARAYAIFGMFIVNYNVIFGDIKDTSLIGQFLALFAGNSSAIFIILAGMGISLLANGSKRSVAEQTELGKVIRKRALFLFAGGLLLNIWWVGDILHMYGCYMFIAAFLLFTSRRYFLPLAWMTVVVFHVLVLIIPYGTGWDFKSLVYQDFYTIQGFLRHTLYNGWNPVFPWMAYFLTGMFLGRFDWNEPGIQKRVFLTGLSMYTAVTLLQLTSGYFHLPEGILFFLHADYLPPFLPFIVSTTGFALILIPAFMFIGNRVGGSKVARYFVLTGQMTLTHYVSHVTIGIILLSVFTGKEFGPDIRSQEPTHPVFILLFSAAYFVFSMCFSILWSRYFKRGPLEILMRRFSDRREKAVVSAA